MLCANADAPAFLQMKFKRTSMNNAPAFYVSDNGCTLASDLNWWVLNDQNSQLLASARTNAEHPNLIDDGAWCDINGIVISPFYLRTDLKSTSTKAPLHMSDIGETFFMQLRITPVFWYKEPFSRQVWHTGAKRKKSRMGKRWCSICRQSISANNFASQHMRKHQYCNNSLDTMAAIDRWGGVTTRKRGQ